MNMVKGRAAAGLCLTLMLFVFACGGGSHPHVTPGAADARAACASWRDYLRQVLALNGNAQSAAAGGVTGSNSTSAAADTLIANEVKIQNLNKTVLVKARASATAAANANPKYTGLETDLDAFTASDISGVTDPAAVNGDCAADS